MDLAIEACEHDRPLISTSAKRGGPSWPLLRRASVGVLCLGLFSCQCSKAPDVPESVTAQPTKRAETTRERSAAPIGTNLSAIKDWTTEHPFVDVFKTSRAWFSSSDAAWGDERTVDLDERGWVRSLQPGQYARTLALWDNAHYPAGKYIILYDGDGDLTYDEGAASNRFIAEESRAGRHVVDIDPKRGAQGLAIVLRRTDPKNPIRNIRVIMPGFEKSYAETVFNPTFVERIRQFSVIRFMDWMATNDATLSAWSDRPKVDDARWSTHGVPVEIMIELAHRLGAEPWFTLPHKADDDYIRRFATLVRERLNPNVRVWIEFSNEVWNGIFDQHQEVARCPSGQAWSNPHIAFVPCYAEHSVQMFDIWRSVFGEQAMRVVRVLASQAANAWVSEQILKYNEAYKHADALAIAPYFGFTVSEDSERELARMTVDQLVEATKLKAIPQTVEWIHEQAKVAQRYGLPLVAYEGGPSFDAHMGHENNDDVNALFDAANRDPRMGVLYTELLNQWRGAGGQLFVNYTSCDAYSKYGRFGLLEYISQPRDKAPKYDAVLRFIADNPQ